MAKAIVTKVHNATDISKGVSIRLLPDPEPQAHPAWAIESAVKAGAATRVDEKSTSSAKAKTASRGDDKTPSSAAADTSKKDG